ncbi:MAG: acyl-CoA thioesterase [Myxococcales bacterium]|nr:acyl-CoA thioesterase [Myxococcales bacterium]
MVEAVRLSLMVRPNDFDRLGHVNNAVALEYLEAGRLHWARHHSLVLGRIAAVVSRAEIDYLRPIEGSQVEVHTRLEDALEPDEINFKVCFVQHVLEPGADLGQPLVRALVHVAFVDTADGTLASAQRYLAQGHDP